MTTIGLGNFLSDNFNPACEALSQQLSARIGSDIQFQSQLGFSALRSGATPLAFACGLAHVVLQDDAPGSLIPLAAPLIDDPDTADQPVYFCDLLLRKELGERDLAGLRGLRFAYNERCSFSGYLAARFGLAQHGLDFEHFGELIHSGGHRQSLNMLLAGEADVAALDSHILAVERRLRPELAQRLQRVIRFGPFPMPPLVAHSSVPAATRQTLREALLQMTIDAQNTPALNAACVKRFVAVDDAYYDPIRDIVRAYAPQLSAADFGVGCA